MFQIRLSFFVLKLKTEKISDAVKRQNWIGFLVSMLSTDWCFAGGTSWRITLEIKPFLLYCA